MNIFSFNNILNLHSILGLMMIFSITTTSQEQVRNFLNGCDQENDDCPKLTLTKIEKLKFPPFSPPKFYLSYEACKIKINETCIETEIYDKNFISLIKVLGSGLVTVPLVSYLQQISMAKTFAQKCSYKIDSTQEFNALGLLNIINSLFGNWLKETMLFYTLKLTTVKIFDSTISGPFS